MNEVKTVKKFLQMKKLKAIMANPENNFIEVEYDFV